MKILRYLFLPAVDQSGVATPGVRVSVDGSSVGSFSDHFCIPTFSDVTILCNASIEQGKDVDIQWWKWVIKL